jgi:hypothetical protein
MLLQVQVVEQVGQEALVLLSLEEQVAEEETETVPQTQDLEEE